MNERIKELAEQAEFRFYEGDKVGTPLFGDWIKDGALEKFAELIIQECMAVAKYHTPDTEECEHTWLIHDKIKEHFGVEEAPLK